MEQSATRLPREYRAGAIGSFDVAPAFEPRDEQRDERKHPAPVDEAEQAELAMASLLAEVRRERRDPTWAGEREAAIRALVSEPVHLEAFDLVALECGSTRCAMEGTSGNRQEFAATQEALVKLDGMQRGRFRLTWQDDGTLRVRAVFARNGYDVLGAPAPLAQVTQR